MAEFTVAVDTKFKSKGYFYPVKLFFEQDKILIQMPFNRPLINEIKAMDGARWHGNDDPNPRKVWSIKNSNRNFFQLMYLENKNPYATYDRELESIEFDRPLMQHQVEMVQHAITRRHCIYACEMGTGKTLAAIEAIERLGFKNGEVWYVGPKSGVRAVGRELNKWNCSVQPEMFTYEGLVKLMKNWAGHAAPKAVIFDESSKIKTPSSQRSQAALALAEGVRDDHGRDDSLILLMSGTPAPKSPEDWWHQCEVACPGFIREGNIYKFKTRLCLIEQVESIAGGSYPKIITWFDDENKCAVCGMYKDHPNHDPQVIITAKDNPYVHQYTKSVNEIEKLYARMNGLVLVKFKKDCLDLPDKVYEEITIKPSVEMVRSMNLIKTTSRRAIEALIKIRELSDGFIYSEKQGEAYPCPNHNDEFCTHCDGTGLIIPTEREVTYIDSEKDDLFLELLDDYEDVGRFIVWAGFTASIDKLVQVALTHKWAVLRVDGRGYHATTPEGLSLDADVFLDCMDLSNPNYKMLLERYPKVCFVGHPQAGGMALTLTGSPVELFYSNSFSGEARFQAEDRFHRAGMDANRSPKIIDIMYMPTDRLVLDNLRKKRRLQDLSMGELEEAIKKAGY